MKKAIVAAALGLAFSAGAAQDPDLARTLAATCGNCHGTNGKAVPGAGIDSLAGEPQEKLMKKLREFRAGTRPATIMHQIAKGYSDEQLELVTAWFAARK